MPRRRSALALQLGAVLSKPFLFRCFDSFEILNFKTLACICLTWSGMKCDSRDVRSDPGVSQWFGLVPIWRKEI